MGTISYFGCNFHSTIDRAGRHDQDILLTQPQPLRIHGIQQSILADRWKGASGLAFELYAQQIKDIAARQNGIQTIGNLYPQLFPLLGHQRGWATDDDMRTELLQAPNIRSSRAAMGDVSYQSNGQTGNRTTMLANRENVEQPLCRVFVRPVPSVKNGTVQVLREQM